LKHLTKYATTILSVSLLVTTAQPLYAYVDPTLPEPYDTVEILPYKPWDSWFFPANKTMLFFFIKQFQPKTVVEIGSWLGASTMFMATYMPKGGLIYAVDHWLGSIEHEFNGVPVFVDIAAQAQLPTLYEQFLSNVIHRQLTDVIVPVRKSSLEAARDLDVAPDLVYVDGSHMEDDVYDDIMAWYPKLKAGGILCGDDFSWGNDQIGYPVKRAVERASKQLGQPVRVADGIFWYFRPKSAATITETVSGDGAE